MRYPVGMSQSTCWTVIRDAADGDPYSQELFARRYQPAIAAYLHARWGRRMREQDLEDALQEIFLECFREGGVLERADPTRAGGFRAFLYGVARNVARRAEDQGRVHLRRQGEEEQVDLDTVEAREIRLSQVFDRAWAETLLREAALRQSTWARTQGPAAERRVELLRMRFQEDLPIRKIAEQWQVEADWLHHEYARARSEFRQVLLEIMAFYHPHNPEVAQQECTGLLQFFD